MIFVDNIEEIEIPDGWDTRVTHYKSRKLIGGPESLEGGFLKGRPFEVFQRVEDGVLQCQFFPSLSVQKTAGKKAIDNYVNSSYNQRNDRDTERVNIGGHRD